MEKTFYKRVNDLAVSGEDYYYFCYADGNRVKVRVEIDKTLSPEDFKFWREKIIEFLNNVSLKR